MITDLETLRRSFSQFLVSLLWCHVLIVAAVDLVVIPGGFTYAPVIAAVCLAAATTLFWLREPIAMATRMVSGVALVGMAAILLSIFAGHPWQTDMHIYFFACLAVLVGWWAGATGA